MIKREKVGEKGHEAEVITIRGDAEDRSLTEGAEHHADRCRGEANAIMERSTSHVVCGMINGKAYSSVGIVDADHVQPLLAEMRLMIRLIEGADQNGGSKP